LWSFLLSLQYFTLGNLVLRGFKKIIIITLFVE